MSQKINQGGIMPTLFLMLHLNKKINKEILNKISLKKSNQARSVNLQDQMDPA